MNHRLFATSGLTLGAAALVAGLLFGSGAAASGAPHQHYVGTINRYGLTLGSEGPGKLTWDVLSVGGAVGPGSLAGTFTGASTSASVGAGIGTNALFGGDNGGITFQPLSIQTETGVNVAAGVGSMTLEYAP